MRERQISQLSIFHTMPRNEVARELEAVSRILDDNPAMYDLVYRDMVRAKRPDTGREGMTAEQVLRCTILKQYRNLSYEELAFHLEDSHSFRAFSRLQMDQRPGVSTLQENIKELRPTTWEAVNELIIRYAAAQRIEKGRKVRTMFYEEIKKMDGRQIPTRWVLEPHLKQEGNRTVLEILSVDFDVTIPDRFFTRQHLERSR